MATITLTKSGVSAYNWAEVQPLTTIWTPPPGCPEVVQFDESLDLYNKSKTAGQTCVPPNYANVWWRNGYYSPGICPHKYTTAMTLGPGHSLNGNWIGFSETAAICIPSGYTVWPHYTENYTIWAGVSVVSPATGGRTYDGSSMVPAFQIRWAPSDLALLATASLTSQALSLTATSSLPGPTSGLPAPTASDSPSPGLATGTIAGIAVGVVVALALMLAAAGWFLLRRYRRERMKPRHADAELEVGGSEAQRPNELNGETAEPASPELDGSAVPVFAEKQVEKDDAAVVEVHADERPATGGQHQRNLPAGYWIPELPAQASNPNDASPAEMDATPAQTIPARYTAELPPNPPLPPAPAELHAAAPGPSHGQTPSHTASHGNDMDGEIAQLLERKARVDERRRALELEQLDAEAAGLEIRLGQLQGGGSLQPRGGR